MLKNFILAAGTLLVATIGVGGPAAATSRASYGQRNIAMHGYYRQRTPMAFRGRVYPQQRARIGYGRVRTARYTRLAPYSRTRQGFGLAQRGTGFVRRPYGRQLAVRNFRLATAQRASVIRNNVGPRSAYTPATRGIQVGNASYYGGGARTASGGFVGAATCAHRSLPFGTRVLVTNLANARQAVLTVNDRGPFIAGRIVDVSTGAAGILGMLHSGTAPVKVQVLGGSS